MKKNGENFYFFFFCPFHYTVRRRRSICSCFMTWKNAYIREEGRHAKGVQSPRRHFYRSQISPTKMNFFHPFHFIRNKKSRRRPDHSLNFRGVFRLQFGISKAPTVVKGHTLTFIGNWRSKDSTKNPYFRLRSSNFHRKWEIVLEIPAELADVFGHVFAKNCDTLHENCASRRKQRKTIFVKN